MTKEKSESGNSPSNSEEHGTLGRMFMRMQES